VVYIFESTANLAFAFQAAAFRVIETAQVQAERRAAVYASLAQMALKSAFGQNLDAQNLSGEENYWMIAQTKSSPFFSASFHTGALLGGASPQVAGTLRDLGFLVGEVFQVYDDLLDAFESPACPDWKKGRNNLAILYALTADHSERTRFEALIPQVDDPQMLVEAQEIMVRCGAVSYCAYHIIRRYKMGLQLLGEIELADPEPMLDLLNGYPKPLVTLLERVGARVPPELGVM
jgi:geranylgeranyl pyrophosphate synthase